MTTITVPYCDNEEEEYYSSEEESDTKASKIFKDNIVSIINDNCYIIKITLGEFVRKTKNWTYNREINEEKVNELLEHINSRKYKLGDSSEWIITLVCDDFADDNNFEHIVIDGQHRKEASRRAIENGNINENITIHCITYKINYCDSTNISKTIDLFNSVNNSLPLAKIDYPHARSINIADKVKLNIELVPYPNIVIKKNGKENGRGANQPFISEKELYNIFRDNSARWISLTDEVIIDNLKKISKKISLVPYDNIYTCTEANKKRYLKAEKYKFWLNLKDSVKYNPNKWIKFIAIPEKFS